MTLLAPLALIAFSAAPADVDVLLKDVDGETVCTVHTSGASPAAVLTEIARKCGREISGLESAVGNEQIPVWLDERPLASVVQTIAACAGLRASMNLARIRLEPDLGRDDSAAAFEEQCAVSYLRALKAHPENALAAEGEMILGQIQERRANLRAANGHYQLVATRHERSPQAPDALLRSGLILERLGEWSAATAQFRTLANFPKDHPWRPRARLEIARCMAELGDGREANFVLDALERVFPTTLTSERQSRLYVRARALLAAKRQAEALEALQKADELGRNEEWAADAMELRAQALAHFERHAEAARAWLAFAEKAEREERLRAWVNAASESLAAGDALGVLCIQRLAAGTRAETAIESLAEEARKELGLAGSEEQTLEGDAIAEARILLDRHMARQALALLEPLYQRREERPLEMRLDLVALHARALAAEKDVDSALVELREALDSFTAPEHRQRLCAVAGALLEDAERYDEAVRAFGGQL